MAAPGRGVGMKIELLDSRRLTGPNLFWDLPGAVADVALRDTTPAQVVSAWEDEAAALAAAVGWRRMRTCSRIFAGGVSLVVAAPIDVLYSACELNETALARAAARLQGAPLPAPDADRLARQIRMESKPALLALQRAAASRGVPFLWDDDEASVGYGGGARVFPAGRIPPPSDVDWSAVTAVPLAIVTGTNGKSTTVRLAASILTAAGQRTGITSTDYISVGGEIIDRGDYSGPGGARTLLRDGRVEAAVLEVARGGLLRRGVGVERADAALITNIAADHLGEYGINSVADMAEAKFIVRRALDDNGALILNADDPPTVACASGLGERRVVWFGLDPERPVLRAQLRGGGRAAFLRDGWMVMSEAGTERRIVQAARLPITFGGAARYNISNALAAMTLAHVLGAGDGALREGLSSFSGGVDVNPGRGNLFEKDGIRIFLDFAHNEHGLKAVSDTIGTLRAKRNIVLMGQAGDRGDEAIGRLVRVACELRPARLLVCELPGYERGRKPMEVPALIVESALAAGVPRAAIEVFASPLEGAASALASARAGDCLVLLALTQRQEVVQLINEFMTGA